MAFSYVLLLLLYLVRVQSDDEAGQAEVTSQTPLHAGTRPLHPETRDETRGEEPRWDYSNKDQWCEHYETCCGKEQSPIALKTDSAKLKSYPPIKFNNYDALPSELKFTNNGRTVTMTMEFDGKKPSISEGGLNGTYEFRVAYFHWGKDDYRGAEHTIDGVVYPFEVQMMHTNSRYKTPTEAANQPNRFAIISILFKKTSVPNGLLHQIIRQLRYIKYRNESMVAIKNYLLKLTYLLPNTTEKFLRYTGSFTHPRCHESVTWTVFEQTAEIASFQIGEFRKLYVGYAKEPISHLVDNFRGPQPLNDRIVYRRSGLATNQHSLWIMLSTILIIIFFR